MPDFDYGAVKQARQVIPGRAQTLNRMWTNRGNYISISI